MVGKIEDSNGNWCCEYCGKRILGKCNNDNGRVTHINNCDDEEFSCDVCGKTDFDVRFEGSFEGYICDNCLFDIKGKEWKK